MSLGAVLDQGHRADVVALQRRLPSAIRRERWQMTRVASASESPPLM